MDIHCSVPGCETPMTMPGAVVISPPIPNDSTEMVVTKYHVCVLCWVSKFLPLFGGKNPFAMVGIEYSLDMETHNLMCDGEPVRTLKTFVKRPIERDPPKVDVVAAIVEAYAQRGFNEKVGTYAMSDVELSQVMLEFDTFDVDYPAGKQLIETTSRTPGEYYPPWPRTGLWSLIKRGWL